VSEVTSALKRVAGDEASVSFSLEKRYPKVMSPRKLWEKR
jgi:hypothetical protein